MQRSYKIILLLAIGLAALGWMFQAQISRFLFHPEGLSTAAAELCLKNKSGQAVVADIEVLNGARTVTFLTPDESACSPAPSSQLQGVVKVSLQEGEAPFCSLEVSSGGRVELLTFSAPDNCEWSS